MIILRHTVASPAARLAATAAHRHLLTDAPFPLGPRPCTLAQVCGAFTRQPMVTPCAHLLCLDCAGTSRTACPLPACRQAYEMQPVTAPERLKDNPRPKWAVPMEVIEWQPVYHQVGGRPGGELGGQQGKRMADLLLGGSIRRAVSFN